MVLVLDRLREVGAGDELEMLLDREPFLLYPELERRGFAWELAERGDAYVLTISRIAGD